jgi:hypothetical protein
MRPLSTVSMVGETEGARRATGVSPNRRDCGADEGPERVLPGIVFCADGERGRRGVEKDGHHAKAELVSGLREDASLHRLDVGEHPVHGLVQMIAPSLGARGQLEPVESTLPGADLQDRCRESVGHHCKKRPLPDLEDLLIQPGAVHVDCRRRQRHPSDLGLHGI